MIDSIHILFIEDEALGARVLSTAIKLSLRNKYGIEAHIDIANTLSDGLECIYDRDYDLILTDLNLPDSTGVDTVVEIKKVSGETPVVPITAYCAKTKGIIKPFNKTEDVSVLVERIYNEITNKRADIEMRKFLCASELMAVFSRRGGMAYGT